MSSSALSALLVLVTLSPGAGDTQISSKDRAAWRAVQPAVVSIMRGNRDIGSAALVDSNGLFLTHLGTVYGKHVTARLSDGRLVGMTLKASDDPTQLAVLQADDWVRSARPLRPADGELQAGQRLLAILPSGMIRAQLVSSKRYGLVAPSKRLMPLCEISFEAPADTIGGALIVTPSGELVGFLNATLRSSQETSINIEPSTLQEGGAQAPAAMAAVKSVVRDLLGGKAKRFGPADMTTAYTVGPAALRRALDNLARGQTVERPSIGVDVKNAPEGGAYVENVQPGSGADVAGIRPGDVVIEIDGQEIGNQVDLAKAVMDQEIGSSIRVKVKRGRMTLTVPVRVGSRSGSKRPASPEAAT